MEKIITRNEAITQGLKYYFTGVPCRRGHVCKRKVLNWECWECARQPAIARAKRNYWNNVEEKREYAKDHYQKNKDKHKKAAKIWRQEKKEQINKYFSKIYVEREHHRIGLVSRRMLRTLIGRDKAYTHENILNALGYSADMLRTHIESLFKDGMSWENYGEWVFDHKRPVVSFVKDGIKDLSIINALDNIQPLWNEENMSKGSKWK